MASLNRLTRLVLEQSEVSGGWQHLPLQLEYLNLRWIGLTSVPTELSRLSRLTELDLSWNELEGGSLHVLQCMCSLGLHQCEVGDAGLAMELVTTLQSLSLDENRLTAVPAALGPLTGLTELGLSRNQLAGGWQHLVSMQQLVSLSVERCGLTAVPQVLLELTALTSLDMNDNPIASGWQHLSLLPLLDVVHRDPGQWSRA